MSSSRNRRSLLLAGLGAAAALSLASCATPTTYKPISAAARAQGGYSEQRIAADRWRVTFAGNELTSRDRVEGYLLYRAAELTREQGYDWFQIVERETEHRVDRRVEPDPFYRPWYGSTFGYWRPSWRYYGPNAGWQTWDPYWADPFWASRIDVRTVERFEAAAEIVLHRGVKPAGNGKTFDARDVLDRLGPQIERSQP